MALKYTLDVMRRNIVPTEGSLMTMLSKNFSTKLSNSIENPGKVVFISQSTDVYENLALEDWFYKNWDFSKRHLLLLWRNSPCVVIGRHQNPYIEANLPYLESADVPVVRRNSGGGTVYHDVGNLNCSFFTPKQEHARKQNLDLICTALKENFHLDCNVNKKHDIVIKDQYKISGTAAKLGRLTAYHHCTLLVSSDKSQMKLALHGDQTMKSKATVSVPSAVANLQEIQPNLSVERVLASIGRCFLQSGQGTHDDNMRQSDGFTLVNPTDEWFPGVSEIQEKLRSWDWFHGMTPLFEVTRPVLLNHHLNEGSSVLITVEAYHGLIKTLKVQSKVSPSLRTILQDQVLPVFVGHHYSPDIFHQLESRLLLEKSLQHSSA